MANMFPTPAQSPVGHTMSAPGNTNMQNMSPGTSVSSHLISSMANSPVGHNMSAPDVSGTKRSLFQDANNLGKRQCNVSPRVTAVLQFMEGFSEQDVCDFQERCQVTPNFKVHQTVQQQLAQELQQMQAQVDPASTSNDVDECLKHFLGLIVSINSMDGNDMHVVAETLLNSLAKAPHTKQLLGEFVVHILRHAVEEKFVNPSEVAKVVTSLTAVAVEVYKAPLGLQPDEISCMNKESHATILKWQELNKLMVARIIDLQTSTTRKYWQREGVKPVAATGNERDMFYEIIHLVKMRVTKPELREFLQWFKTNVPERFKLNRSQHSDQPANSAPSALIPGTQLPAGQGQTSDSGLGLKANKTQLTELRRWIARSL
ncbi:unnamed protein product, partial [Polarella glacialis]